jgi:hypothetical protein
MRPRAARRLLAALLICLPGACAPPDSRSGAEPPDAGAAGDGGSLDGDLGPGGDASGDGVVMLGLVGPAGGTVRSGDGDVELVVPPGALDRDVTFWIIPVANAPAGHLGTAVDIGPDGTRFALPVRLGLRYDDQTLGGLGPAELTLATVAGGRWDRAPAVILDERSRQIVGLVSHLSIWALVPAPQDACRVDLRCAETCCQSTPGAASFQGSPARATCLRPKGGLNGYADCYADCLGAPSAAHLGSPCLRRCCQSAGGQLAGSGLCQVDEAGMGEVALQCAQGCLDPGEPVTVCPQLPDRDGHCAPCSTDDRACATPGAPCVLQDAAAGSAPADPAGEPRPGRCQLYGRGCARCVQSCAGVESCGNDRDDDCNGVVDDGCAARACTASAECALGEECRDEFCSACGQDADPDRRCQEIGGSCSFLLPDASATVNGRCQLHGRGCGQCVRECAALESCGNDVDDDCNGAVDDGCAARVCAESAHCPTGQQCAGGYCHPCEVSPQSCTNLGGPCPGGGRCQTVGAGCGLCTVDCAGIETCGNDVDDDCDGLVDDGCAALACAGSSQCAPGHACHEGYCLWCLDRADGCLAPGGTCLTPGATPAAAPIQGTCVAHGRGCGICLAECHPEESCGNDVDDDCNGQIDDGCAARACSSSLACAPGQHCQSGSNPEP